MELKHIINLTKEDIIRGCEEDTKRGIYPSVLVCYKGYIDGIEIASEIMHHFGKTKEESILYNIADKLKGELLI